MPIHEINGITPALTNSVAVVDTVDPAKRIVHMKDKMGGNLKAMYTFSDALFQIPQQGERWSIVRKGWYWHLDKRQDRPDEADKKHSLPPGDSHLRSPGTLHIDSKGLQLNSNALGTIKQERTNPGGSVASKTLLEPCVNPDSIQVFSSGALVDPSNITLDPDNVTLHFSPSLSAGVLVIYYQR